MTRKDYKLIAEELKKAFLREGYRESNFLDAVNAVANALERDNPRFDYSSFRSAVFDK
jgi:enterochelin esterase-like enzyme